MIVTHKFNMDFTQSGSTPSISVVQDDKYSRNLELRLFANGAPVDLTGLKVLVRYRKPDGTGGNYDTLPDEDETPAGSIDGNTVTVALAPQVCTVPGVVRLAVGLIDGTVEINTFPVDICVQANPGLQVMPENYFKIAGALADSGWEPNKFLATDENGNVVAVDAPEGGSGGDGGYYIPSVSAPANGQVTFKYTASKEGMEPGNAWTVDLPEGPAGPAPVKGVDYYTDADKAEMVAAVTKDLPVLVDADGLADLQNLRQITSIGLTKTANTVDLTFGLEGDKTATSTMTLGDNGLPEQITVNGRVCPVTWDGFDDAAISTWEGGSY